MPKALEPVPEGVDSWDIGSPVQAIDWTESMVRSPVVIPGVTTMERTYGDAQGEESEKAPMDVYIGIDCSGSMMNPACGLSYPVLAGTVIAVSALRAGARAMACLSGEPGKYTQTDGFTRDRNAILGTLVGYLGTGYAFGIGRLRDTFVESDALQRLTHILVVSDTDMFMMLDKENGWETARAAVARAGAGGTFVLEMSPEGHGSQLDAIRGIGWDVYCVSSQEELVAFAAAFSRAHYGDRGKGAAG
jgi:hypothetical protein